MQNWTDSQKFAIETRNKNLIISAAAGSGKTAVLIERIFQIIKEGKTDISNILMITFTRKAASEMKEKLQKKLDYEIENNPEDLNLKKQRNLLDASDIKTIDSFCLQVLKNHFNEFDLDLKFQIIDDKKNIELKAEVLDRIFEEEYKHRNSHFINLVETYGKLESDEELRKSIIDVYDFSQSNPDPFQWLQSSISSYIDNVEEFEKSPVGQYYKNIIIGRETKNITNYFDLEGVYIAAGADEYTQTYEDDLEQWQTMLYKLEKEGLSAFLNCSINFKRLSIVKKNNQREEHINFKETRNNIKDKIKELTIDLKSKLEEQAVIKEDNLYLIDLVSRFNKELIIEKRKINLFDYNDIEHFALNLLERAEYNEIYRQYYQYICIDEYQDTNGVQERIFNLIARENNMFYVGDLKQSIYRFRLADSSIFQGKLNVYTKELNSEALTLNKNFRSSHSVVNGVNSLFNHLMDGYISPVKYKEDAQLVHGSDLKNDIKIQTHIIDLNDDTYLDEEEDYEESLENTHLRDKVRKEAEICANKIRHMVDNNECSYKDFTILANSVKYIVDPFKEIFDKYGIPLYGEVDTGFIKSLSVGFIIDYLDIINNINNDLALINVLKSPIYNFTLEELGIIRKYKKRGELLINSLNNYLGLDEGLSEIKIKIKSFLENIAELKIKLNEHNLTDYTILLLLESKYYFTLFRKSDYEIESLNIKELLRLISDFEKTNNSHLSGFLKYFKHIEKNDISLPSSSLTSEEDDVVKIQTIHKSKGLEYENVFLVKLGDVWKNTGIKQINFHQKLGIGTKIFTPNDKNKIKTLNYEIINKALSYENLEDKLNLLYVAMTRAKNNLFLVGSVKKYDKYKSFNFDSIIKAKSMYDLILPIIFNEKSAISKFEVLKESVIINDDGYKLEKVLNIDNKLVDEEFKDRLLVQIPRKLSATDFLKINSIEKALTRDLLKSSLKIKPDFLQNNEVSSAEKGILFHLIMELVNFNKINSIESLNKEIMSLIDNGVISHKELETIDIGGIFGFFNSNIFNRITKSLYFEKEKPFNLMVNPSLISNDYVGEDKILVQGIIDLYFMENSKYILIDYKTDHVDKLKISIKLDEYKKQLELYKMALENIKGVQVAEAYLYFSNIKEFIKIDFGG
ncbi:MAG: UvrD-helicase domain-containing protein [Firmicutes bacterium]|nr:UvrD-helicase domain-containing protein [Bacillota bacterium]